MRLVDWRGTEYGEGSLVAYCEHYRRSSSRMLVGRVVEASITEVVIEVLGCSRGTWHPTKTGLRTCQITENITVLES